MISVVIPTLNAAAYLQRSLPPLFDGVLGGVVREVIVTDGGSTDATAKIADAAGCVFIQGPAGRGAQLIAGAGMARSPWMLFLHADTALAHGWTEEVRGFIRCHDGRAGYFRFCPDQDDHRARRLAFWVNLRCRVLALPYGDQGLLISRRLYDEVGGYAPHPLMEDVDLVRRLGRHRLAALRTAARTSVARHVRDGYGRRSAKNLWLLIQFLLGASPRDLARRYE